MRLRIARSALVGAVATLADLLSLVVLVDVLHLAPRVANLPALLLGVAIQFAGNKQFAFRDRSSDWLRQGAGFAAVEAGALVLNALAFHVLIGWLGAPSFLVARLIGSALVYFLFSYPLWGLVFRGGLRTAPGGG